MPFTFKGFVTPVHQCPTIGRRSARPVNHRSPSERTEVTSITRFPIRRMDIALQVDYAQDSDHVYGIIAQITRAISVS